MLARILAIVYSYFNFKTTVRLAGLDAILKKVKQRGNVNAEQKNRKVFSRRLKHLEIIEGLGTQKKNIQLRRIRSRICGTVEDTQLAIRQVKLKW